MIGAMIIAPNAVARIAIKMDVAGPIRGLPVPHLAHWMVLPEPDLREKLRMFLIERLRQFSKHDAPVAVNDVLKTINRDQPNLLQMELALMLLLISPLRTCTFSSEGTAKLLSRRTSNTKILEEQHER